ncbi:MAG TPA: FkbM family methyltransferase [Candidatus Dormibacteraeota bacterium]|nr:FkbM family methyltransferase [Candidatus Dormibacteraeota bacterium]
MSSDQSHPPAPPADAFGAARSWLRRQGARDVGVRAVPVGADAVYPDTVDGWLTSQAWRLGLRDGGAQRLIAREMAVGGLAVDVGAYLGWYAVALARRAGATGRVIALEPETGNFDLLTRAVGAGRFPQIDARQVAAAEYSGWTSLYVATGDRGDHRIVPADEERRTCTVRAVSIDDLVGAEPRLDFLKISVQGAEVSVLRGARRALEHNPALRILCAVAPALLTRAGASAAALFEPLAERGFAPYRLERDGSAVRTHATALWAEAQARGRLLVLFRR